MSDWIKVEDMLPGKSDHIKTNNVLLWCPSHPKEPYIIGYGVMGDGVNYPYEIIEWKSLRGSCKTIFADVTHWQPLPLPPNK